MFLTKITALAARRDGPSFKKALALLPSPLRPLLGRRAPPPALPDNIICFCRRSASDLNRPQRGRALHHRFVLMLALRTGVTVRVDDTDIPLREGRGLLVFPFQFHDYAHARRAALQWLFVTFDMADNGSLEALRNQPFDITPAMARLIPDLVAAYLATGAASDDMTALLLALLLAHMRRSHAAVRKRARDAVAAKVAPGGVGLMRRVNELAEKHTRPLGVKELAAALGISASHLRARFRESCGVSIGRHVRRLRLEKARGLLRLSSRRVGEVAELCGFSSVYTFSRAFHTVFGVAPLEYRKNARLWPDKATRRR